MKRRALLALPALAALGSCAHAKSPDSAPGPSPAIKVVAAGGGTVPLRRGKVMLGAYVALKGVSASAGLASRHRQLGRDERIVHRFYSWTDTLPAAPDWIAGFAGWVKNRPAVGAAVWFDTDTHPGSAEKWRIDSTAASLRAYRAMADDPLFQG